MSHEQSSPRFSVVIPTYSRPDRLRECLESLARMKTPAGGFEVLVVDDGSPQSQVPVIAEFLTRLRLTALRQENAGPATARNQGALYARGRYVVFLDDDCRVDANWLVAFDEALTRHPDSMFGGRTENRLTRNPYSSTSQLILDLVYDHYNGGPDAVTFTASNNIVLPAERYKELEGFDASRFSTAGGEDRDFCDRWVARFGSIRLAEKAVVGHFHEMTLWSFWKQNYNYGRGAWSFHCGRSEAGKPRLRLDLSFHLAVFKLLRGRMAGRSVTQWLATLPLMVVWQVANAAGFFREGCRIRRVSRPKTSANVATAVFVPCETTPET